MCTVSFCKNVFEYVVGQEMLCLFSPKSGIHDSGDAPFHFTKEKFAVFTLCKSQREACVSYFSSIVVSVEVNFLYTR